MKKLLILLLISVSAFAYSVSDLQNFISLFESGNYYIVDIAQRTGRTFNPSECSTGPDVSTGQGGCRAGVESQGGGDFFFYADCCSSPGVGCSGYACYISSGSGSSVPTSYSGECPSGYVQDDYMTQVYQSLVGLNYKICKKISCPVGYKLVGNTCTPLCPQNETLNNGSCQCFPNMTRGSNGVCSSCPTGTNMFPNSVCYGPCPTGTSEASSPVTKSQLCLATSGNVNAFFSRKNADGTLDVIKGDGSFIRYDKDGKPVVAYDNQGNAINVSDYSVQYPNPRGSIFNPVISAGLVANGYLIASAGVLASASGLGSLPGAAMITVGGLMILVGGSSAVVASLPASSSTPPSGGGSSGGTTQLELITLDSNTPVAPSSTTTSSGGSTTKVYKPDSSTTITETTNTDGSRDYQVKDNTTGTVQSVTTPPNYFDDKGAVNLAPTEPITVHAVTDTSSVTGSGGTYVPDPATGGYIPANPQTSGGGSSVGGSTSGGGVSAPAGGGSSSTGSGGSMGDGQTSAPAGTDGSGSTDGTGEGKDFGDGFGDFLVFKDWDDTLSAVDGFKNNISDSFTNLNKSISDAKNAFQGDKIHASIGSGAPCNLSFATTFGSADFTAGMTKAADIFRPFIIFIVSVSLSVLSFFGLYKVIRGGAE